MTASWYLPTFVDLDEDLERLRAIADSLGSPHARDLLERDRRLLARRGPVAVMARLLECTWQERVAR